LEVKLSDIGEGMAEATINCYFVKPGDVVKADQPLVEVQTDKMTAEIPAPAAGVIKDILAIPGESIPVGTTLLILEKEISANVQEAHNRPKVQSKRIMASPYTRKMARENGILIDEVIGTGPGGRITDEDVYRMLERTSKPNSAQLSTEMKANDDSSTLMQPDSKIVVPSIEEHIPFRGKRKQIAKKMVQSLHTIAHCTHFEEIDVSALIAFRDDLKKRQRQLTMTAFFLKALSQCLKEYPIFNANLLEDEEVIRLQKEHHIGVAVDTEDGLIVPVIRNVEKKSISDIHTEVKALTQKALQNQLTWKDISGGTFTISNVGPLGGSIGATPIIQHPEVALVSFHKTKKRPVVIEDDQIVVRPIMNISMSFDHRVADGATAVAFTNRLTELIENPNLLLLELV
jgi:2-oxoisovalerate dehydrogenase E2 component (dihydrolipoyl transacylase)